MSYHEAGYVEYLEREAATLLDEVKRLQAENTFFRDRLEIISAKMDGEHVWRFSSGWPPFIGPNVDEVMRRITAAVSTASQQPKMIVRHETTDKG